VNKLRKFLRGVLPALGAQMKQERERKGISLDDAAKATKISTRFLRAIETDDFEQLPGGIFNKGFIRAYARLLGMDPEEAVSEYLEITGAAQVQTPAQDQFPLKPPEFQPKKEDHKDGSSRELPWGMLAAVLLVIALGVSGWRFLSQQPHGTSRTHSLRETSTSQGLSSTAIMPSGKSSLPDATASNDANAAGQFTVTINFREDCWVTITADGKDLINDVVLIAGTNRSFTAEHELVVKAGNVGGVDFEFNGKALPRQGELDEVKTLTFDANGLRTAPAQPEPAANAPANPSANVPTSPSGNSSTNPSTNPSASAPAQQH